MQIRVGLTTNDLTKLLHHSVSLSAPGGLLCSYKTDASRELTSTPALSGSIEVSAKNGVLHVTGAAIPPLKYGQPLLIQGKGASHVVVNSLKRAHGATSPPPHYAGTIEIRPAQNLVRIVLLTTLENYIKGVLQSEIPASYHPEAIKAQAVAARTYALRPRIDHTHDGCNVCDSFLCCQYFAGVETISTSHAQAIAETAGQILTYEGKPILALFSSNAGGCTEDYQNCFSDPVTDEFPPAPLPYLKSASEVDFAPNKKVLSEENLRAIWFDKKFVSADSWSPHFRWQVTMPASAIEAHMHHEIEVMRADPLVAPFIVPPQSEKFGHINNFKVVKRGQSGTAIELAIETSTGTWTVKKELLIRSVFKNSELNLTRLKSAKLFFDFKKDSIGLLSQISVHGLGWGHGVGMQQTGAQGWAKSGKTYRQILSHYFEGADVTQA